MKIQFKADRIRIKTMADGSFQIIIDTGEYAVEAIKEIVGLPRESAYDITIEPEIEQ